jgi:hypothetical protein
MPLHLVSSNDPPNLYASFEDEPHWHDEPRDTGFLAVFGSTCFFAGCMVTAVLALVIPML